jgi:hypothetical protein
MPGKTPAECLLHFLKQSVCPIKHVEKPCTYFYENGYLEIIIKLIYEFRVWLQSGKYPALYMKNRIPFCA